MVFADLADRGKVSGVLKVILDAFVKSPGRSLRGARRRGNPLEIQMVMRLPRFARNDKSAFFGLFTSSSFLIRKLRKSAGLDP